MADNRGAGRYRRSLRRYGRTEAICDATSMLMEQFDLDAAQAVAQLVKVSKLHNDSIEAAAHSCVAAGLGSNRHARTPEAVGDQPHHRRMRAEWFRDHIGAAVA